MPKNIVLCCDGTSNEFGAQNTNVVRLVQVLERDQTERQRVYYDPGVGTLPEPGWGGWLSEKLSILKGLAIGYGLDRNVEEAYSYLMDYWEQGDRVFLFGFSRGAYTVRVLAGLLHTLGLLPRGSYNMVPYLMRLYKAIRQEGAAENLNAKTRYFKICNEFRWTFARPIKWRDSMRRFRTHFAGVWDTVSSVGWLWTPARFPFTRSNPSIAVIRHAVALDERRAFFRQNLFKKTGKQDLVELWFPGVHADVGGGYEEVDQDFGLWRTPFQWMVKEAKNNGLLVNERRLREVLRRHSKTSPRPWLDQKHESLTPGWWFAEFIPKNWRLGRGRPRRIPPGSLLHESVLRRIRDARPAYAPRNLSDNFLASVRGLAEKDIAGPLAYVP